MERIDRNERAPNYSQSRMMFLDDPKITMLPIVFTKKLDNMESINANWESLSFKKISTMLLEESKPEYNPRNKSKNTLTDLKSFNKLENKVKTYLQSTKPEFEELNLKRIIEMALNNIKDSTTNENVKKECHGSSITVKNEPESCSSDDEALVSVKRRKMDIPKDIDNQSPTKTETKTLDKPQNSTKTIAELLVDTPMNNINKQIQMRKTKAQVKAKKNTTTVAEVQSQLEGLIVAPIRNSRTAAKIEKNKVLVDAEQRKSKDNERQKKNQTKVPDRQNENTKIVKDTITINIENQSKIKNKTKTPDEQNENERPLVLKDKIRLRDIGSMSIFFLNTGLMAKQQKVTEERYDIGKDGNLEKFFIQLQPPRDLKRYSIQKTVCCLYKRAQVITEILDEYEISPTAVIFLRAAHLCEVGACLCCCKPNRSAAQSDAVLNSRILDRNEGNSLIPSKAPQASFSGTFLKDRSLYATDKIVKNLWTHNYKLSIALKGLVTSLLTNFKGITLTAGSTGKLSAVFNTTFTSWNNTDIQLITTILSKMRKELFLSDIPSNAFCECVNQALNADNLYSQASTLLSSKQSLMSKQYSLAYFHDENKKVSEGEDPKIEYFRGDLKLLQASSIPGPSGVLNEENEEATTGRRRKTIQNNKGRKRKPRNTVKRSPKRGTKRELRNKSPESFRECVFVPESTAEEPTATVNYNTTVPIKNPILNQMLNVSAPQSTTTPDFSVKQTPFQYLVSVPVTEKSEIIQHNNIPQTENIVTIDISSDEETILP